MRKTTMLTSILGAVVALAALEGVAAAEPTKKVDEGKMDVMTFTDDKLLTVANGAWGGTIGAGHIPVRTLLVRPRTHFVPELIKTIENL